MQSQPHSEPQLTPLSPSKSLFRPHKTHLSITFKKSSLFYDDMEDDMGTQSFFKNLKVNKKNRVPSGITSLTIDSDKINARLRRSGSKKTYVDLLKEFRNLQSLKITGVSFKDFPVFGKALKSFRGLKSLEITFKGISCEDERNSLQNFIKEFSPRLRQLKLDFPGYFNPDLGRKPDYNGYQLKNFRIDRLNNLKTLALSLPISSFLKGKGDVRYIDLSPMKRMNALQGLDLTLVDHTTDMRREMDTKQLHFNPNKLFPNLKKFTWNIRCFSNEAKKLELVGPQITSQLKYLDDFGLGYRPPGTAKASFVELGQCLATLQTKLNSLHFASNGGELSEQDTKALFSALSLQRLKSLHTLSLEFSSCKGITNGFLADLAQACAENFPELRSLRLSFEPFEQDKSKIPSFVKTIFGMEGGVSDKGIKKLASIISKGCQDLEFVSLEFKKYSQISDSGAKSVCRKLDGLKRLKTVWIRFEDCGDVTRAGCENASELLGAQRYVVVSECKTSSLRI